MYRVLRFSENPMIHPGMDERIGTNINGPSIIRVPDWVSRPLGRYYLYFASHHGTFIRMAFAENVRGPWTLYRDGVLDLKQTCCVNHIASPDVHVLGAQKKIIMYFHGCVPEGQRTLYALSGNGIEFQASSKIMGPFYLKAFPYRNAWYALAKTTEAPGGGVLLRSEDGISEFEPGQDLLPMQRHVAVLRTGYCLEIFYTRGQDCPERILLSTMSLERDWKEWKPTDPVDLMDPKMEYEGGFLPLGVSRFGAIDRPVRELRDPAILREEDRLYLLYCASGEGSICGAELNVCEYLQLKRQGGRR